MKRFLVFFTLLYVTVLNAQNSDDIQKIRQLINSDKIEEAETEITNQIKILQTKKNFDSLAYYVYYLGKIELLSKKENPSFKRVDELADMINNNAKNPTALYRFNLDLALLNHDRGKILDAYKHTKKAKKFAEASKDTNSIAESEYYLGEYGMKLGNFNLLETHTNNAYKIIKQFSSKEFPIATKVYHFKAMLMYFTSKPDSANFYFTKAIKTLNKLEKTSENEYYLKATIYGNWTLLRQSQGNYKEAMAFSLKSAKSYKKFLKNEKNHPFTTKVKTNLSLTYRNIGSLYNDLGDLDKQLKFAKTGYHFTKQNFTKNTYQYFNAVLLMAESNISIKNYNRGLRYLNLANESLNKIKGDNFLYKAQLYSAYGRVYYYLKNYKKAIKNFELGGLYYKKSHKKGYNRDHFFQLLDLATLYAENEQKIKALDKIKIAQDYLKQNVKDQDYLFNALLLTSAQIAYKFNEIEDLQKLTKTSLNIYRSKKHDNIFNKLHFEENKAEILLLNAKAKYLLKAVKDTILLKKVFSDLNKAIDVLEEKKPVISTLKNVNNLIEDNKKIFDFSKKINLELYYKTNNSYYLDKVISLHESSIYNRIRARLNLKNDIKFLGVSSKTIVRENKLRKKLLDNNNDIQNFTEDINKWNSFLDSLKTEYPKYYKMRYATIEESLDNLQKKLPNNSTIIRYLFIEDNLYAFIISKTQKEIIKLNYNSIKEDLYFKQNQFQVKKINSKLYNLYVHLWKPFEDKIKTENIIIIPDGVLFNLSFETLTPSKINSFKELATNSLLAKHTISYNYSLLLLDKDKSPTFFKNDFIAFTPEFTSKMKSNYKINITDSIDLDKTYLALLPQPFSKDIAKKYTQLFNGSSYANEKASKQIFSKLANEHKIIHIGTHAESNNLSPELSRLVFAKNVTDTTSINDNYLYTYEIYNQNLNSNLAILTACETGKPTYQPGEGMISLAHAFTYAGSESILTSLWKIDEQSSTQIISSFYDYLTDGLPKDKALRNAKLDYISTAQGRTIAPQYWAGLVLIGDASPIELSASKHWWLWILITCTLLILLLFYIRKK